MLNHPETREHLARLRGVLPENLPVRRVVMGFDGYIDRMRRMVDERESTETYRPIRRLRDVGERIRDSVEVESSCTIEWVHLRTRTGGHIGNVAGAFDRLGFEESLIGTFGQPIHEAFERDFGHQDLLSIGEPGYTDCVEFEDGKLMLPDSGDIQELDWDKLLERVGMEELIHRVDGRDMITMGYWSIIPSLPTIWRGLSEELWPRLDDPPEMVGVDPADLRQHSPERLREGVEDLRALDRCVPVVFSANTSETRKLTSVFTDRDVSDLAEAARIVRSGFEISCFAAHAVDRAALATREDLLTIQTPRTEQPEMTTGAGDHFAAGLLTGLSGGWGEGASLLAAGCLAGCYVRKGGSPDYGEFRDFVKRYESLFDPEQ